MGHVVFLGDHRDGALHEVHGTEQVVGDDLNHVAKRISFLVGDPALVPLVGGGIGADVAGHHGAVGQGDRADGDVLGQLSVGVALDDPGDVLGIDQRQAAQLADLNGLLLDGGAGAGATQGPGDVGVIENVGDGVFRPVHGAQVALLNGVVDDGGGRHLGHQDVLENSGNPLFLQEERVVGHDRAVAGDDGLHRRGVHGVLLQQPETVGVVVVEGAVQALLVGEDRRSGDALHHAVQELLTDSLVHQDGFHRGAQTAAAREIGQHGTHFALKAHRAVSLVVVADHRSLLINRGIRHIEKPPFVASQHRYTEMLEISGLLMGRVSWVL